MDRHTGYSEKMLTIGTILRKFENGEKFFPGKSILEFDGKTFIDKVKNHKDWSDAQKIAAIAVAKATVFGTGGSMTVMPFEPELIVQFWDEAYDVLKGDATLLIDLCDIDECSLIAARRDRAAPRYLGSSVSPYGRPGPASVLPWRGSNHKNELLPHKMLNCTTNEVYHEYRPYIYWWNPTYFGSSQRYSY